MYGPDNSLYSYGPGDTFVFSRGTLGKSYFISSAKERPVTWSSAEDVWAKGNSVQFDPKGGALTPQIIRWGEDSGQLTRIFSFAFSWRDFYYGPFIEALPELINVNSDYSSDFFLNLMTNFLFEEAHPEKPGFGALAMQTSQLFLVHCIRSFAVSQDADGTGWLRGFSDAKLSRALASIHDEPERKWKVAEMGELAGMSRSVFAKRFSSVMGESPMDYLRSWRMHLARLTLEKGDITITKLANDIGYQSEAAFRSAFRKKTGLTPRDYIKQNRSR